MSSETAVKPSPEFRDHGLYSQRQELGGSRLNSLSLGARGDRGENMTGDMYGANDRHADRGA